MGKYEELERLQKLKENGALTEEEFEKEKKIILSDTLNNNTNKVNQEVKQENKTWKVVKIVILIVLAVFVIVVLIDGFKSADKVAKNIEAELSEKSNITMSKFNQIKTGMTYSQVVNIIGFSGILQTESGGLQVYTWQQSSPLKIISISVMNGKVTAKSQVGLAGTNSETQDNIRTQQEEQKILDDAEKELQKYMNY